jgi:hypothetical protein
MIRKGHSADPFIAGHTWVFTRSHFFNTQDKHTSPYMSSRDSARMAAKNQRLTKLKALIGPELSIPPALHDVVFEDFLTTARMTVTTSLTDVVRRIKTADVTQRLCTAAALPTSATSLQIVYAQVAQGGKTCAAIVNALETAEVFVRNVMSLESERISEFLWYGERKNACKAIPGFAIAHGDRRRAAERDAVAAVRGLTSLELAEMYNTSTCRAILRRHRAERSDPEETARRLELTFRAWQTRGLRRGNLAAELTLWGLGGIRSDSKLCAAYIDGAELCDVAEVAAVMAVVRALFDHGGHIMFSHYHSEMTEEVRKIGRSGCVTWQAAFAQVRNRIRDSPIPFDEYDNYDDYF